MNGKNILPHFALILLIMLQVAYAAEEDPEPSRAVLFPWFAEAIGLVVFYLLTRYIEALPYTAVIFLLGTCMGVGAVRIGLSDQLTESILQWDSINSEVLLLVFLPGLIFNDAFGLNVHLFGASIWQCLILAFPMVLAGTVLTALIGYYVFPYNWSFNLAMTFGSILSATDPVAVSALLDAVGAPPRLKMHISGESLLNDGSAMVFFTIFSQMYLFELGVKDVGKTVDVAQGFAIFFQMSLGGAAVGFAFALGLISVLYLLNRRLNSEENVLQVAATVTFAYLTYYTADQVCATSGVIATLTCGVITQAFAKDMINDQEMMENFWGLVEHLLNTLLFALGGVVWGGVIANHGDRDGLFNGTEWGYLFLLFVLLNVIRFFLVFSFYPLVSRIELKSNWREAVFLSYGGLRGAVGISLAIALDNQVWSVTKVSGPHRAETTILFGMIGGVAFLTLVVNGTTSGPLLQKLGLAKSTEIRERVLEIFKRNYKRVLLGNFGALLADKRFREVDHDLIRHHVSFVRDLSQEELEDASAAANLKAPKASEHNRKLPLGTSLEQASVDPQRAMELRTTFIEQLKWAYRTQIEKGELNGRVQYLAYVLQQSLEFSSDAVAKGSELNDWEMTQLVTNKSLARAETATKVILSLGGHCNNGRLSDDRARTNEYKDLRFNVLRAMAFIEAHSLAQERFEQEFQDGGNNEFIEEAKLVMKESDAQVVLAMDLLNSIDGEDVKVIVTHLFCTICLNQAARHIDSLATSGLLSEKEASGYIENIEGEITSVWHCSGCINNLDSVKEGEDKKVGNEEEP